MTDQLSASVYQTAEQFLRHNRPKLVQNAMVTPQWIDGGARFRYDAERAGGPESVLVDPLAGTREIITEPAETVGSGELLLVHGGLDTSVNPHHTLRLVDRLIAADKDFDLLIVPGAEHIFFGYEHYVNRRKWDFLVRNLHHAEPPPGYRLTPAPVDLALVASLFG